ncbi:MAG: hypothetical protein NTX49_08365 [Chlamydiae bacterium]|nr:hypothetical protein [Chlamydiota bacterium]
MNRELFTSYSSDNFWADSNIKNFISTSVSQNNSRVQNSLENLLSPIDEMPDFHDPYSEVNLFLSERIKTEIKHCQTEKKWTLKFQEDLIHRITPEFRKKFPHYRLGVMAIKKTWEKVIYYTQQIEGHTDALSKDGSLNIAFFIKENLKQYAHLRQKRSPASYHYAHQLASKISEFSATIDGKKPEWDFLTRTIWSMQKHLLIGTTLQSTSPYDEPNKTDHLIQKILLEITAKEGMIAQKDLEHKIIQSLDSLHELGEFSTLDKIACSSSALLAEKLYPYSPFHTQYSYEEKSALLSFIERHSSLYKLTNASLKIPELVRRIVALYTLSIGLPRNLSEEEINAAVDGCYPLVRNERPPFSQAVYAFISAELQLMKNDQFCKSVDFVKKTVFQSYLETISLPKFEGSEINTLQIIIWKTLSNSEGFLEKLPYKIGQKIDEEIGYILVDNPCLGFEAVIRSVVRFFQIAKEISEKNLSKDLREKAYLASMQGDMIASSAIIDEEIPLIELMKEMQKPGPVENPTLFVASVIQAYLRKYPDLAIYASQVSSKTWIYFKCLWYTRIEAKEPTVFDRFIAWHSSLLRSQGVASGKQLTCKLQEICNRSLPLIPLDTDYLSELLGLSKEEKYA